MKLFPNPSSSSCYCEVISPRSLMTGCVILFILGDFEVDFEVEVNAC